MNKLNWSVVGHQGIVKFLEKNILSNKLAHAYLFYGPANVGKGLVATELALNLLARNVSEAERDRIEHQIKEKSHPDVHYIERLENKKNISIDQVRELRISLNFRPFSDNFKIVIINKAEELSEAAANSFLKLLEELPVRMVVILLVNNLERILPTISSRCQLIKFNPVAISIIKEFLIEKLKIKKTEALFLSELSFGRPGLVIDLLKDEEKKNNLERQTKLFLKILNSSLEERMIFASQIEEIDFFAWQVVLRNILLIKNELPVIGSDNTAALEKISQKWSDQKIYQAIFLVNQTERLMRFNLNKKLVLENLFINL